MPTEPRADTARVGAAQVPDAMYAQIMPRLVLAAFLAAILAGACTGPDRPGAQGLPDGASERTEGTADSARPAEDAPTADGGGANHQDGGAGTAGTCGTALSYLGDDDHEFVKLAAPQPTASFVWALPGGGAHVGNWFRISGNNADAFSQPTEPPRDGSMWARSVSGPGSGAGVALWVQLVHPTNSAVNLGLCSGMTFWARLAPAGGEVTVALNDGSGPPGVADNRGLLPARSFSLGPDWQQVKLPLPFAPGKVSVATIEFFAGSTGEPVDLQIDDLALICTSACP